MNGPDQAGYKLGASRHPPFTGGHGAGSIRFFGHFLLSGWDYNWTAITIPASA